MYRFTTQKNNKSASTLSLCLFLAAAVLFLSPSLISVPYKMFWQLGGIACLVAAVAILTRFVFKSFRYDVVPTERGLDLNVTEIQGKSVITVCRIGVSNIEKVLVLSRGEKADEADLRDRRRFSYIGEMFAQKECVVLATECGERLLIRLSHDDELVRILTPEDQI